MPRAVITGAAGFIPSHVCEALLAHGWEVVGFDNFVTGRRRNLAGLLDQPGFTFVEHDVCEGLPVEGPVDAVLHLASPASPADFERLAFEILDVGSRGTTHALELARRSGARFVLASSSEVYGDPLVHPQPETYWGNVNPDGPRSVYDESKRFAEAVSMAYRRRYGTEVKLVRIFNTFGERLQPRDGRVISNLLDQALRGAPLTIYGDGTQTRSFCYVSDQVAGILAVLDSDHVGPINIGSSDERTILEVAKLVVEITGTSSEIVFEPLPVDDPARRCPDTTLAQRVLGWQPIMPFAEGLARTAEWYRRERAQA